MRRIQQTTLKIIRKPIKLNSSSLYICNCKFGTVTMRTAPNTFGAFAVRARARCILPCACAHSVYLLADHCFPCTCSAIKDHFSLYTVRTCTVYRTIVVSLSVRMRTVRNTNSWLNLGVCARNVSPCLIYFTRHIHA